MYKIQIKELGPDQLDIIFLMNIIKLAMLVGRDNIATQLDEGHRLGVRKHNEEVDKNRHVLSKIIDCVKLIDKSLIFSLTVIVVLCFLIIPGRVAKCPHVCGFQYL